MGTVARLAQASGLFLAMTISAAGQDAKLGVVAAENFYADIVRQIGGDRVEVASILSNPNQDPHLFETTPTIVRQIAAAQIVIFNGAGYDAWMDELLKAAPAGRADGGGCGRACQQKGRRQPAHLVRANRHADGRSRARQRLQQDRSRACSGLRRPASGFHRLARSRQPED